MMTDQSELVLLYIYPKIIPKIKTVTIELRT